MTPHPDDPPAARAAAPASNTNAAAPVRSCLHCGETRQKLQRCGGCRRVYFCDRDCQVRVWRQHRPQCSLEPPSAPTAPTVAPAPKPVAPTVAPVTQAPAPLPSALHTKRTASPKTVRLVTEPVQVLELPAAAHDHAPSASSSSASKKKKKHKKKKRSNSLHAPASAPLVARDPKSRSVSLSARKHVMWGDVHAREYSRFPGGGSTVPYDGTWALGLGAPVADVELGSVLDVEQLREQELQSRIQELPKSKRALVREGETRQFDYRRGAENPLFARLSERERKQIFTASESPEPVSAEERYPKRKSSISTSPHKPRHESAAATRARRLSDAGSDLDEPDFACVSIEQLDEFAKIRDSRDAACGCSCGDLVKKVSKMHVKRLHAFLAERDVAIPSHNKSELLALAKAVAAKEKNCANARDCECARNGVECHSNVCDGCAGDCWNPFKAYMYDKQFVVQYRKQQLAKWREAHASDDADAVAAATAHQKAISVV